MGSILQASCSCGFRMPRIGVGGGMMDFEDTCMAPAICKKCDNFLVLNLLNKSACCPKCKNKVIYYNDPSLQEETDLSKAKHEHIFSWYISEKKSFVLPPTKYYCPKCKKMELEFRDVGCWD